MSAVPKNSSVSRAKVFCLLAILSVLLCSGAALASPLPPLPSALPSSEVFDLPTADHSLNYIEQIYVSGTTEVTVTIVANMDRIEETFDPAWSVYKITAGGDKIGEKLEAIEFEGNYGVLQFTLSEPGTYKVTFKGVVSEFIPGNNVAQRDMYLDVVEAEDGSLVVYPSWQSVYILPPSAVVLLSRSESASIVGRLRSIYSSIEILQMVNNNVLATMFGNEVRDSIRDGTIDPNTANFYVNAVAVTSPEALIFSMDSSELISALSIDAFNFFINYQPYEEINLLKPVARGRYSHVFLTESGFDFDTYGEIVGQNYSYSFRNGLLLDLSLRDLQYSSYSGEMVPILNESVTGAMNLIPDPGDEFQMHIVSLPSGLIDLLNANNDDNIKFGRVNVPRESVANVASMSSLSFPTETINSLEGTTIVVSARNNGTEFLNAPEVSSVIDSPNTSVHLLVDVNFSKTPEELNEMNKAFKANPVVLSFKVPKMTDGVPTNTDELRIYHIKEPDTMTPVPVFEELVIDEIIDFDDDFYEVITKTPGFSSFAVVTVKQDENPTTNTTTTSPGSGGSSHGSATVSNNSPSESSLLSPKKPDSSLTGSFIPRIPIPSGIDDLLEKTKGHFTLFSIMAVLLSGIGIWYYIRRQV